MTGGYPPGCTQWHVDEAAQGGEAVYRCDECDRVVEESRIYSYRSSSGVLVWLCDDCGGPEDEE